MLYIKYISKNLVVAFATEPLPQPQANIRINTIIVDPYSDIDLLEFFSAFDKADDEANVIDILDLGLVTSHFETSDPTNDLNAADRVNTSI